MSLVLIGYRGTGKSSVGRQLAARLGWEGVDADDEIERQAGKSIAAIFDDEGEPAFRDWESRVLADWVGRRRIVLAVGGGAILREENRRALAEMGPRVWLKADAETIHWRISGDANTAERRPNLTARGGIDEIRTLLAERTPIYRQCATAEVDTEGRTTTEVVDEILVRFPDLLAGGDAE